MEYGILFLVMKVVHGMDGIGLVLLPLLPPAFDAPIRAMFALGIAGMCWHIFIKRR
jgi:hypothetical protein